ncbi:MAG: PQQ-binding-like beta-propeller repeat protein [Taibaiella sp.]|nr:PQQ-binding-like beta-propeller repeat protein [Taibaiella sp.]
MLQRWSKMFLSLAAVSVALGSCKPKPNTDDQPLPEVYNQSIIIGSDNQVLYAINPANGDKNWELGLSSKIIASPIIYNGYVYVAASVGDTLFKIDSRTGKISKKITFSNGGAGVTATPIADDGKIYVGGVSGAFCAIDTGTGKTKWSFSAAGPIEASPTMFGNSVYVATTTGYVYRYGKQYGNPTGIETDGVSATWSYYNSKAKFVSSPAIGDPYLFVGSVNDSNMYCLYLEQPPGGGSLLRWTFKTEGGIRSSPTAYKGTCIFGCDDFNVYCIDTGLTDFTATPDLRWKKKTSSEVTSSPFAYGQTVFVGCKDYNLYALKIQDGTSKWQYKTAGIITSSPLCYGGVVYIGSYDKYLYALDTMRGTVKWKHNINGQPQCSPVLDDLTKLTGHNTQISGYEQ